MTTRLPAVVAVLLLGLAAAEGWYLYAAGPDPGTRRPVVVGDLTARSVVDQAAQSLTEIASTSYRNYDEQVDQATTLMTPDYAAEFRATAASLATTFAEQRRETAVRVVASAVVRATDQRVEALVFVNSQVSEGGGEAVTLPYRTLVTMARTDHGWLVSDISTK